MQVDLGCLARLCCKPEVLILLPVFQAFPSIRHGRALQGACFEIEPVEEEEEEEAEAELVGIVLPLSNCRHRCSRGNHSPE